MIKTIRHRGLKRAYERDDYRRLMTTRTKRIATIMTILDNAETLRDLNLPNYHLHPLKGDLAGLWSMRVNQNWRIIFRMEGNDIYDVDLVDYH